MGSHPLTPSLYRRRITEQSLLDQAASHGSMRLRIDVEDAVTEMLARTACSQRVEPQVGGDAWWRLAPLPGADQVRFGAGKAEHASRSRAPP
jgi:hypothetical protein